MNAGIKTIGTVAAIFSTMLLLSSYSPPQPSSAALEAAVWQATQPATRVVYQPVGLNKMSEPARIRYVAEKRGIDPILAEAISRVETGHFRSVAFTDYNNYGGLTGVGGVMSFETRDIGLEAFISTLEWYYRDGLTTVEEIASRYCPVNRDNWIRLVKGVYREIKTERL